MAGNITRFLNLPSALFPWHIWRHCTIPPSQVAPRPPVVSYNRKAEPCFVPTIVKLACFLFSFSFTCIVLGVYCPTTKRLLRGRTDSSQQIETLASLQSVEDGADEGTTAPRNDWTITNRWRFYVNIRFGVALNLAEGANAVRGVVNTMLVVLLAIAAGCTGFVTSIAVLSLTWLVPSVRKPPPEITKKPRRRTFLVQPQEPLPLLLTGIQEKAEAELVPRPEPVRLVSFKEQATVTIVRSPAPVSAPSSPRGRPIPLPRCKSRTVQSGAVSLLPASAPVTPDNSPLSSAETLTESPTEIKRAFSARLTRALPWSRSSTIGSTTTASSSPSSTGVVSEFGESLIAGEKGDGRANVTQRGMFGFLKKTRTIDVRLRGAERASRNINVHRPGPISLPSAASFTSDIMSSPESIPSPWRTNSPSPISSHFPVSSDRSDQRPQHRRVMSTPTASPKLRITDKFCPRKEKDKVAEPKPKLKPARTQPYGPPYNWIPPTPGAWAVAEAEEADEYQGTIARRRKRVSAPTESPSSRDFTRHEPERSGDVPIPNPAVQ